MSTILGSFQLSLFKKEEEKENISWFIDISFSKIYFIIKKDTEFNTYRPYIHELLDLIIKHRITPPMHLIFILEYLKDNNISCELIKNKIWKMIYIPEYKENLEEIKIRKEDLLKLFHFSHYILEDIFARIFLKLYNTSFHKYNEEHYIEECYLISEYIKSYEDYKWFIKLVLYYDCNFTYIHADEDGVPINYKIDINYFFSGLKNKYFKRYINELIQNNNKKEVSVLIKAIPIKSNYKELLVDGLNFLENEFSVEEIITLLTQERTPSSVYIGLFNEKTSLIPKNSTYDYVMKEINEQETLFTYISEKITNIGIVSEIDEILDEIKKTKNIVLEINLEFTIT